MFRKLRVLAALAAFGGLLLLTSHTWWLEVGPAACFRKNPVLLHTLVEAPEHTLESLAFHLVYFRQSYTSLMQLGNHVKL